MIWNVVTLFPEAMVSLLSFGVIGQAFAKKTLQLNLYNPRDFAKGRHNSVDDRPFGGGDGMILQAEVLDLSLEKVQAENPNSSMIYLSPQGKVLNETLVHDFAKSDNLTLICGRYGGLDQRVLNRWHGQGQLQEISIGDYVLSGGEMAAGVFIDAVSRKIPGVLGHEESAASDSHAQGWLEAPLFTRPRIWRNQEVPEILLSGNHEKIGKWRQYLGVLVTLQKRPDLWELYKKNVSRHELLEVWESLTEKEKEVLGLETQILQRKLSELRDEIEVG